MSLSTQLLSLLLESGLTESQALVYQALLNNPSENAFDLVKRTGLSKTTVYRVIEELKNKEMIKIVDGEIKAASLKTLVSTIENSSRKFGKLANKLRKISPFLHLPKESVTEFEYYYGTDQVAEQYVNMAGLINDVNLDFGDFETILPRLGGISVGEKFRQERVKRANHRAICTTFGPYTSYFCTKESQKRFRNNIKVLDMDFKNNFLVFSENGDQVLYVNYQDEMASAVSVKSKIVADMERQRFSIFSRQLGKF